MMKKRPFILVAIISLALFAYYIIKKGKHQDVPKLNLTGIDLKDLNGGTINLSGFAGKPLVINFWGTWCGPCRQELPGFEKVKEKYADQVNFLMVSDEQADKIIKFKEENSYTFLYARSQKNFREMGIPSVPFTYFYDATGRLINIKKDPLDENELNGFVAEMLR